MGNETRMTEADAAEIKSQAQIQGTLKRFTFHKPDAAGIADMRAIRVKVRELAKEIEVLCPLGS